MGAGSRGRKRAPLTPPRLPRQHPAERTTAEDVQVIMRHLLHAMRAGIGDRAKAIPAVARPDSGHAADFGHAALEIHDLGIARGGGEMRVVQ